MTEPTASRQRLLINMVFVTTNLRERKEQFRFAFIGHNGSRTFCARLQECKENRSFQEDEINSSKRANKLIWELKVELQYLIQYKTIIAMQIHSQWRPRLSRSRGDLSRRGGERDLSRRGGERERRRGGGGGDLDRERRVYGGETERDLETKI